jgi:hypothetical protein
LVIAVLDFPGFVGVHSGSSHQDVDLTSWHEGFLWNGEILVHNPAVSILGEGLDFLGKVLVLGVVPPDSSCLGESSITIGIGELSSGSDVNKLLLVSPLPLLGEITSKSVMDDGLSFLLGQNHIVSGGIRFSEVEPHASVWLHGGGNWLIEVFGEFWGSVALNDLNIEIDIGTEWDWLSTNWGPGVGITPCKV